jgi:RNA-binding protein
MSLTSKQRKALKAQAHHLNPVIRVGQNGISEGVIQETGIALNTHELIKVQIQQGDRDARLKSGTLLAEKTGAELVHRIGKIIILYRLKEDQ